MARLDARFIMNKAQWQKYQDAIDPSKFGPELTDQVKKATELNSIFMVKTVRKFIRASQYSPNEELTLNLKRSSKPLIGHDSILFGSINYKMIDAFSSFVGIRRGAKSKTGEDLVNLATGLHEGMQIPVTPKMRALFKYIALEQQRKEAARQARAQRKDAGKKKPKKDSGDSDEPAMPYGVEGSTKKKKRGKRKSEPKPPEGRAQFLLRMARGRRIRPISEKTTVLSVRGRPFIRKPFNDAAAIKRVTNNWRKAVREALKP